MIMKSREAKPLFSCDPGEPQSGAEMGPKGRREPGGRTESGCWRGVRKIGCVDFLSPQGETLPHKLSPIASNHECSRVELCTFTCPGASSSSPGGLPAEPSLDPWVEGGRGVRLLFCILGSCSVPSRVAPPFPGGTRGWCLHGHSPACPWNMSPTPWRGREWLGWLQRDPPSEFPPCPVLPRPVERRSYVRQSDKRNGLFKGCVVC